MHLVFLFLKIDVKIRQSFKMLKTLVLMKSYKIQEILYLIIFNHV